MKNMFINDRYTKGDIAAEDLSSKQLYLTRLDRPNDGTADGISLGSWCLTRDELQGIIKSSDVILDCSMKTQEENIEANRVVSSVFERLLPSLSRSCNRILNTSHNTQFWRVLYGYWFRQYLDILYERYFTLLSASKKIDSVSVLLIPELNEWIANDTDDYSVALFSDQLNHQIYGQIIRARSLFNFEESNNIIPKEVEKLGRRPSSASLKWIVLFFSSLLGKFNRIVFLKSYFYLPLLIKLSMRFRFIPLIGTPHIGGKWKCNLKLRNKLSEELIKEANFLEASDFERLALELIPKNLPGVFFERFFTLYRLASWLRPYRADIFLTANAYASQEIYKVWVARAQEESKGLHVIVQHGGNYGHSLIMSDEEYEVKSCSVYLTSGWNYKDLKHVRPFIPSILTGLGDSRNHKPSNRDNGDVVWVLASLPRYYYTQWSAPQGTAFAKYLDEQVVFVNRLSKKARFDLLCRPYHYDYGWGDIDYLKSNCDTFRIDTKRAPLRQVMVKAQLMVFTYDSTSMMESMVMNTPTICYWNLSLWPWRDLATPLLKKLKEVGIYHESSDLAAEFINSKLTEKKLDEWWSSPLVQKVRNEYCEQYANTSDKEYEQWSKQISTWL
jgi:putative transferase (TIGR04331 family)